MATLKMFQKTPAVDAERDFVPVAQLVRNPYVLAVLAALPFRSVQDLVAHAKANLAS